MTPVSYSPAEMGRGTEAAADSATKEAIARAFVNARKARTCLSDYPGSKPDTLAEAYAIQDAALALWDVPVVGWKVGRINAPLDRRLGSNRLAGPVIGDAILDTAQGEATMQVVAGGFAAGEAEFMIRLGAAAGSGGALPVDDAGTIDWIDAVRIGIEIAASPYPNINADGPCVTISDHGNNWGLVFGAEVPRERWTNLAAIEITSAMEGHEVGKANAGAMLDGPLGAVRFLLGNLAYRGIEPQPGWWISTGAVTGVHEIAPGQTFRAAFEGLGEVACRIEV